MWIPPLLNTNSTGLVSLTPSAQILLSSLPLAAIVLLAVLSFFFILWDYRNNRLIIEKGGTPIQRKIDEKILLIGIVSLFVGLGLLVFFAMKTGLNDSLLGGIIPTTAGLGIITYYALFHRFK